MANWLQLMRENVCISEELVKKGIYNVSIWGKGKLCNILLQELKGKVKVLSIIESHPSSDEYQGIRIVDEANIPEETQMIIVIPVYDLKIFRKISLISAREFHNIRQNHIMKVIPFA